MASALDDLDDVVAGLEQLTQSNAFDSDDEDSKLQSTQSLPHMALQRRKSLPGQDLANLPAPTSGPPSKFLPPRVGSDFSGAGKSFTMGKVKAPTSFDIESSSLVGLPSQVAKMKTESTSMMTYPINQANLPNKNKPPPPLVPGNKPLPPPILPGGALPSSTSSLPPPILSKPVPAPVLGRQAAPAPPPGAAPIGFRTAAPPPPSATSSLPPFPTNSLPPPSNAAFGALPSLPPPPVDLLSMAIDNTPSIPVSLPPVPKHALPPAPGAGIKKPISAMTANVPAGEKFIMNVTNLDGSLNKKIEVHWNMSGQDLFNLVLQKLGLEGQTYFGLAFSGRNPNRYIDPEKTLKEQEVSQTMILKVRYFKQPKALDSINLCVSLFYIQTQTSVASGLIPITDYLGVKLGALQIQIVHGDHDPKRHTAGFFKHVGELSLLLPEILVNRYKLGYWERRLLTQHAKYKGLNEIQAKLEYLRVAKKSPAFGATVFELLASDYALLGIAEDGILFSKKLKSLCGDWLFFPYEHVLQYSRINTGINIQTNKDIFNLSLQDDQADAAIALIHDYYSLFRVALDPSYEADSYLPDKSLFELPSRRVMLSSFPSRLEWFKDAYQKAVVEANTRPLLVILENVDRDLDEGKNCEIFDLSEADLTDEQWHLVRKALVETFSYKAQPGQIFVENFTVQELRLSNNSKLSPAAIESLVTVFNTAFPARVLNFSNINKFSSEHCKALANVLSLARRIDSLIMENTELGDHNAMTLLKSVKNNMMFRQLNLANSGIHDMFCFPMAIVLQGHPGLADVDLSNNPISDDGFKKIVEGFKQTRSMIRVNMSGTKVHANSCKKMIDVTMVRGRPNHIEFANTKLSQKTALKFAALLENTQVPGNIYYLDLTNADLSKKGANAIAASLEMNKTLEVLRIGGNDLDKEFMSVLSNSLRQNTRVRVLSLKDSSLGTDGYNTLSEIVRVNSNIHDLDISGNSISVNDMKIFSEALLSNHCITSLNLSSCTKLGGEGVSILIKSLGSNNNTTLKTLNCDGCNIGDNGAKKVGEALSVNSSIVNLSLNDNGFSAVGVRALIPAIEKHPLLHQLKLRKNSLTLTANMDIVDFFFGYIVTGKQVEMDEDVRELKLDPNTKGKTIKK